MKNFNIKIAMTALLFGSFLGSGFVLAEGEQPGPTAEQLAAEAAATAEMDAYVTELEAMIADRDGIIMNIADSCEDVMGPSEQTEQGLAGLNDPALLEVVRGFDDADCAGAQDAFKQVSGYASSTIEGVDGPTALGDSTRDLVFTPVTPCRIIDTRNYGTGQMAANEVRHFQVWGNAVTIVGQGGEGVCASPKGEPAAVLLNVTPLTVSGGSAGNIQIYPYLTSPPAAAFVHYKLNTSSVTIDDNAGSFKNAFSSAFDISIRAKNSKGNVVVNVMGYYYPVREQEYGVDFGTNARSPGLSMPDTTACTYTGTRVWVYADGPGEFHITGDVRAWLTSKPASSTWDTIFLHIGLSSSDCPGVLSGDGYIQGVLTTGTPYSSTNGNSNAGGSVSRVYRSTGAGGRYFYFNVRRLSNYGATNPNWTIQQNSLIGKWYPDNF